MKKFLLVSALSLSLLVPTVTATLASQPERPHFTQQKATVQEKKEKIQQIKEFFKEEKLQQKLIKKINNDELLDVENPEKQNLGKVIRLNATSFKTEYPDGSYNIQGIDFSEATFTNDKGEEVENPYTQVELEPSGNGEFSTMGAEIGGGTKTSGSGYVCTSGATVKDSGFGWSMKFKANWCTVSGSYNDYLSKVYDVSVGAGGEYNIEDKGVFRMYENVQYSAYGGVRAAIKPASTAPMSTYRLYIRVGNNTVWLQWKN